MKVSWTMFSLAVVAAAISFVPDAPEVMAQVKSPESRPPAPRSTSVAGSSAAARALPAKSGEWTPERVRAFVLHVESEMERLQELQVLEDRQGKPSVDGTCHDEPVTDVLKASFVLPRVRGFVTGKALPCYVATYLGCTFGAWIGRSFSSVYMPGNRPFPRSKVTIVEQRADRVVADVVEAAVEEVTNGVIGEWDDAISKYVEHSDELLSQYKEVSRYTITRGTDGVWRISDRKPPFKWECSAHH
jgi:hypothetical protein